MKVIRIILGILLAFIALNAFGGGYYALAGAKDVPLEWLEGSPFSSYFIPGLFLFIVVGGFCLTGSILMFANSKFKRKVSFISGLILLLWIIFQVIVIGYVSWMQPAIFFSGIVILILTGLLKENNKTDSENVPEPD